MFPLFLCTGTQTQTQTQCQAGAVVAATDPDAHELAPVHDPRRFKKNKKRKPPATDTQDSAQRSSGVPKKKNRGRRERSDKLLLEQIKGVLNGTFTEAPSAINRQLLPTVSKLVRDNLTPRKGMRLAKEFGRDRFYAIVADDGDEVLDPDEPGKTTMQFHVVYTDGDEDTMTTKEVKEHYAEFTDDMYISNLEALVPAFDYLESRLTGTSRSESHSCVESLNIAK